MCVERVSAMCTAGMPRSRSVALEGRLVGCLYNILSATSYNPPPPLNGRDRPGKCLYSISGRDPPAENRVRDPQVEEGQLIRGETRATVSRGDVY